MGCADLGNGAGEYSSQEECESNCLLPSFPESWYCGPSGCFDPGNGAGEYSTLMECESNCFSSSWDCGPSGCFDPGNGAGEYSSPMECDSICDNPVICTSTSGIEIISVGPWENPDDPCDVGECTSDGDFTEIVIECDEEMGVLCNGEW